MVPLQQLVAPTMELVEVEVVAEVETILDLLQDPPDFLAEAVEAAVQETQVEVDRQDLLAVRAALAS